MEIASLARSEGAMKTAVQAATKARTLRRFEIVVLQQPAEARLAPDVDEVDRRFDLRFLAAAFLRHRQVVVNALMSFGRLKPATNRRIKPATYQPAFFFDASPYALSLRDLRRRRMRHTTRYGGGRNAPIAGWFIAPTDTDEICWQFAPFVT
jgi:hypothetical protein